MSTGKLSLHKSERRQEEARGGLAVLSVLGRHKPNQRGRNRVISVLQNLVAVSASRNDEKSARRANQQNPVQPSRKKYSLFSLRANHRRIPRVPSQERGGSRSSRTRGGMRWTRQRHARGSNRRAVFRERKTARRTNGAFRLRQGLGGPHTVRRDTWRRRWLRTAKPCGPGTRCWCQAGGGDVGPTGPGKTLIRRRR
jgi:hypothetical protein